MKIADIFDSLATHRKARVASLVAISALLAGLATTLHFSEDIGDFLPFGTRERAHMSVYQNVAGADRIVVLFSNPSDEERTMAAVDAFVEGVSDKDSEGWCESLTSQFDMDDINQVSDFVYDNIPYFLTPEDYERMDSLLAIPGYVPSQMARDKEMLVLLTSPFVSRTVTRDPLALFSPVMERLQSSASQLHFEMIDGYVFTPDLSRAVVMMNSPFGSSETDNNSKLLQLLGGVADAVKSDFPDINVSIVGGPAIAVGNSARIKKDSMIAISLSIVLIVLLLAYSFNSLRNILLIFLSVGWGLLFALGGMAVFSDKVSIIVIGISSVILGIAVNYPLHLVAQVVQQPDRKASLQEIVSPLVVGNITTVGAFLALVPLKSTALRDLGTFASLLLIGTILFVLIYLPHFIEIKQAAPRQSRLLNNLARVRLEDSKVVVIGVVAVTLFLACFCNRTGFDSNIADINYMTEEQRADMQYFEDLLANDTTHRAQTLYIMSEGDTMDSALAANETNASKLDSLASAGCLVKQNEASSFIVGMNRQSERLDLWADFVGRHREELTTSFKDAAEKAGFSSVAFGKFIGTVDSAGRLAPMAFSCFEPLTSTIFSQNFTSLEENGKAYAVTAVNVEPENVTAVKECLDDACFDTAGISDALSRSLSDNFNYIGWVCSLIVFLFLWFSLGSLELAIISFLPMAISWVWILGIMSLAGIKFNIVNIILATFIFGQGDDYTIFMTEGCQYEFARRKPILAAYKVSILESAAIMFVGIGTLIVARHPAMRSLAEVTIIGMFSVVLMAYIIPPFLFKWLTSSNGRDRRTPITLRSIFLGAPKTMGDIVFGRYVYKGKDIERCARRNLKREGAEIVSLILPDAGTFQYVDNGYGELAILLALSHPDKTIQAVMADPERVQIARIAAEGLTENIIFI